MKIFLVVLLITSCSLYEPYEYDFDKSDLYYDDYSGINSYCDIGTWMNDRVEYIADRYGDDWASPVETIERGYGDCEDFARLFLNILFIRFGIKGNMVLVETTRTYVNGGDVNHAYVEIDGKMYESQYGWRVDKIKVGWRYTHNELFY